MRSLPTRSWRLIAVAVAVLLVAAAAVTVRWWAAGPRGSGGDGSPQASRMRPPGLQAAPPSADGGSHRWAPHLLGGHTQAGHDLAGIDDRAKRSIQRAIRRANLDPFSKVYDAVSFVLQDVVTGEATAAERGELEERIAAALERAAWGEPNARRGAAARTVASLLAHAADHVGETDRARGRVINALAHNTAGELFRELVLAGGSAQNKPERAPALLSWRMLTGFDHEKGSPLPSAVTALDGAEVVVDGYMLTLDETSEIRTFLLVESLWSCCFGEPPEHHQAIVVHKPTGPALEYLFVPLRVSGRLEVGEERQGDVVTSVHRLTATKVEPSPHSEPSGEGPEIQ